MLSVTTTSAEIEMRRQLLRELQLLDASADPVLDRIVHLCAQLLDMPMTALVLFDREHPLIKAASGLAQRDLPGAPALCCDRPLAIADARADDRIAAHPLVSGEPYVRGCLAAPLHSRDGLIFGALCAFDSRPCVFDAARLARLDDCAELLQREIRHRETDLQSLQFYRRSMLSKERSEAYFRASFEQAAVGIAIIGLDGRWTRINDKLSAILGYTADELLPLTFQDVTHPDDLDTDLHLVAQVLAGDIDAYTLEKRYIHKDGSIRWANLTVSLMRDSNGAPLHFISVVEDIHARKEAEAALAGLHRELERRVEERTRQLRKANELLLRSLEHQREAEMSLRSREAQLVAVLENAHDAYISVDREGLIAQWNRQAELLLGWSRAEIIGHRFETIIHARHRHADWDAMRDYLLYGSGQPSSKALELDAQCSDGRVFAAELRISPLPDETGFLFCAFLQDITERKQFERALQHRALHDALTGLPNRIALFERLGAAGDRALRTGQAFGVLFLDLDGFKAINDRYGHDGGDAVLQAFAQRLSSCVRKSDLCARLAGDEFVILLEPLQERADAELIAEKILQALQEPFLLQDQYCNLGTSIGIHIQLPDANATPEQMLKQADLAMYQAKRAGKSRIFLALGS